MTFKTRITNLSIGVIGTWSYDSVSFGTPVHESGTFLPSNETAENAGYTWVKQYHYRDWNTTPAWKTLLATTGYLPTLNMSERLKVHKQPAYTLRLQRPVLQGFLAWNWASCPTPSSTQVGGSQHSAAVLSELQNDALIKARSKARDMKVNLAVALGEGRQTIRMIADIAEKLGRAYQAFRKRDFKKAAKTLGISKPSKESANHWLAYSYGWKPLLSDVKGLAELAAQQMEPVAGRRPRFRVRATSYRSVDAPVLMGATSCPPPCSGSANLNSIYRPDPRISDKLGGAVASATAGLLCEIESTGAALAAQTGFALTDPLLLAWELTPFSFVFDWFIDVGGWLEDLSAMQGIKILDAFSSVITEYKGETQFVLPANSSWKFDGAPPPRTRYRLRTYTRSKITGGGTTMRVPLSDGLNARRIITTAALWRQRLRGDRVPGGYNP